MNNNLLTVEDQTRWQQLHEYLLQNGFDENQIGQLRQLAIASSYALGHLSRHPQWAEWLTGLDTVNLRDFPHILVPDEPANLIEIKQKLRQYRHEKLVQIIFLDVVKQYPLRKILAYLSELAELLIQQALIACEKQHCVSNILWFSQRSIWNVILHIFNAFFIS